MPGDFAVDFSLVLLVQGPVAFWVLVRWPPLNFLNSRSSIQSFFEISSHERKVSSCAGTFKMVLSGSQMITINHDDFFLFYGWVLQTFTRQIYFCKNYFLRSHERKLRKRGNPPIVLCLYSTECLRWKFVLWTRKMCDPPVWQYSLLQMPIRIYWKILRPR